MTMSTHHYHVHIDRHHLDRTCLHTIAHIAPAIIQRRPDRPRTRLLPTMTGRQPSKSTAPLLYRLSPLDPARYIAHPHRRSIQRSKAYLKRLHCRRHVSRVPKLIPVQERALEMDCAMERGGSLLAKAVRLTTTVGTRLPTTRTMVWMEARWRASNPRGPFARRPSRQERLGGLPVLSLSMRLQRQGIWSVCHQRPVGRSARPRRQQHYRLHHHQLRPRLSLRACLVAIVVPVRHRFGGGTRREDRSATHVVSGLFIPRHFGSSVPKSSK